MTQAAHPADNSDLPAPSREDLPWGDPPRHGRNPTAPVLSAEGFEGPLDWLLDMARAQKIDLARLPIAALIQSFVDALEAALARPERRLPDLARWGDWLVMAATLAQMRSRLLLPADAPQAKAAQREAEVLRRRLIGRAQMWAAADWLAQRPQLGTQVFPRGQPDISAASRGTDITDLLRACLRLLQVPAMIDAYRPRPPPFWRVSDAIARIGALLGLVPEAGSALAAFLPRIDEAAPQRDFRCRVAVATTLLASLELAREGVVALDQPRPWTSIQLRRAPAATVSSRIA